MKKIHLFILFIYTLFIILFFGVTIKGQIGNPVYYQTQLDTRVEGPFESSNSTARYALTQSIVKNHSMTFSQALAKFSAPDVVVYKGKYFSIFTPGVSFIGVPFYMLGEIFGIPQLMTYASVLLFSIINLFLIVYLAIKLGAKLYAGLLSGFIFLFATNAFAYALSFTQHQESVTIVLLAFANTLHKRTLLNNLIFGILVGVGALIDIPNVILLVPLGLYIIYKQFEISKVKDKIKVSLKVSVIGLLLGVIPLLGVFGWYNSATSGSFTSIAQFIGRTSTLPTTHVVPTIPDGQTSATSGIHLPFNTRIQIDGLYTLLISNERSWIYYAPIVFIGCLGLFLAYNRKEKRTFAILAISVILVNIVLYSMFGDPWGGWSFGPRYLIPAAALLSVGIGLAIQQYKRNILFIIIFFGLLFYSLTINAAGALTTSAIPPKIEAIHLASQIPYTYAYNFQFIAKNESSSLLYNIFFIKYISLQQFLIYFVITTSTIGMFLYGAVLYQSRKERIQ